MSVKNYVDLYGTRYDFADGVNLTSSVEASSTAAASHAQGSYFLYNGLVYKATAAIAVGDTITPDTNCVRAYAMEESGGVGDVQINGSSIVSNGVANIPVASSSNAGIVKVGSGLNLYNDSINVSPADKTNIAAGSNNDVFISAKRAHTSAFYGLAKAAGDTSQSQSDNAVGTYTSTAIDKILTMLGIDNLVANHEGINSEHAYAISDAFIYDGKLYKATAAIAINDVITPGTNCTQTTLVDLIKEA